jgi:hypothetical protein
VAIDGSPVGQAHRQAPRIGATRDIAEDVNAKIDRRLAEFGHCRDLVESCDDPGPALMARFAAHEDF